MNNDIKIAPSILYDFSNLKNEIIDIEKAGADFIHLDGGWPLCTKFNFWPPINKIYPRINKISLRCSFNG